MIVVAQAVASADGVVGLVVVGERAPPPSTEYVRERFWNSAAYEGLLDDRLFKPFS